MEVGVLPVGWGPPAHLRQGARRPGKLQESQRLPGERKAGMSARPEPFPTPAPGFGAVHLPGTLGGFPAAPTPGCTPPGTTAPAGSRDPLSPRHQLLPTLAGMGMSLPWARLCWGRRIFPTCGDPEATRTTNSTHATNASSWGHWEEECTSVRCHHRATGGQSSAKGRDKLRMALGRQRGHPEAVPGMGPPDLGTGTRQLGALHSWALKFGQRSFPGTPRRARVHPNWWGSPREQHLPLAVPQLHGESSPNPGSQGTPGVPGGCPSPSVALPGIVAWPGIVSDTPSTDQLSQQP